MRGARRLGGSPASALQLVLEPLGPSPFGQLPDQVVLEGRRESGLNRGRIRVQELAWGENRGLGKSGNRRGSQVTRNRTSRIGRV